MMSGVKGQTRYHTLESIKVKIEATVGKEYSVLADEYISYSDKNFKLRHNKCGHEYTTSICNFFNGSRCHSCKQNENGKKVNAYKKTIYNLEWAKKLVTDRGINEYKLLSTEYNNVHQKVDIQHLVCNSVFSPTLNNFRQGTRCPICTETSRGERFTKQVLQELGLVFTEQQEFEGLRYKRNLKVDFWLEDLEIAIEYDGDQHYRTDGKFYKSDGKIRDEIKNKFFAEHGVPLIRIPYHKRTVNDIKKFIVQEIERSTTIESTSE